MGNILSTVKSTLTVFGHKARFFWAKNSPAILTYTGIACGIGATAMAVKATLGAKDIYAEYKEGIAQADKVEALVYDGTISEKRYSHFDAENDRKVAKIKMVSQYILAYAPAAILTGASIACVLSAHHIMSARYSSAVAAFGALSTKFDNYRSRVREEVGDAKERDIYNGVATTKEKNDKGKTVEKKSQDIVTKDELTMVFGPESLLWDQYNSDMNVAKVRYVNQFYNDKLRADGVVFVNDILEYFGEDRTQAGQILGWYINKEHPYSQVDLGVFETDEDPMDWTTGEHWDGTTPIKLTFNVDGIVYDKM